MYSNRLEFTLSDSLFRLSADIKRNRSTDLAGMIPLQETYLFHVLILR